MSSTLTLNHKNSSHTTNLHHSNHHFAQQQQQQQAQHFRHINNNQNNHTHNNNNIVSHSASSINNLSDSRTGNVLSANPVSVSTSAMHVATAPTPCQRLSQMFRRSIADSVQSSSRENTYEEGRQSLLSMRMTCFGMQLFVVNKHLPFSQRLHYN